ncbi:MAG TPA: glycosyltransferase, partial [Acidimicrobiia bacterium]|nr:glycosyltransferase [Acidimicrobiia bacterium]
MAPRVSVIVPAYNPGPYLREAIDSVLAQDLDDWDLVVVDDESEEDLSWVGEIDPRVTLLPIRHGGLGVARNTGINASASPYVAFLDADDRWKPTKLRRQVAAMATTDAPFSYTAFDFIDADGTTTGAGFAGGVSYLDMLGGRIGILPSCVLVRRDALHAAGVFHTLMQGYEDFDLFLRLSRLGTPTFLASVEVEYRVHGSNLSSNYWRGIQTHEAIFDLHEIDARFSGDREALRAIATGRRALRRTYAYKAIDAARAAVHEGRCA